MQPASRARARSPSKRERRPGPLGRAEGAQPETGHQRWMSRRARRREHALEEIVGPAHERREQAAVGALVGAEAARGQLDRALEHHRRAVVQRMGQRRRRVAQLEAVGGQRKRAQEGRGQGQRVHGRAGVVHVAGQGELGGAAASAERLLTFQHGYRTAGLGQRYGPRQPVGAGPDDYRVAGQWVTRRPRPRRSCP